jgi:methyl-accepting chemotaxis protein
MQLSIRNKLVLLCVLPVLLFALLISGVSILLLKRATDEQVRDTRSMLVTARKTALEHSVEVAQSAISAIYAASTVGDMSARDRAVSVLKGVSYGTDGYFFGYDSNSIRVFWSDKDVKIGESFKTFQAPDGLFVINELVRAARDKSHFLNYTFPIPNSDKVVAKIGYAVYLEKWNLVIGTAVNVDDIEAQVEQVAQNLTERSNSLINLILLLSIAAFTILAIVVGWLVRRLLVPLEHIRSKLDEIAEGDGDLTQRLPIIRQDELGQLSLSFNRFVEKIQGLVGHVASTTHHLNILIGDVASQTQRSELAMNQQRQETEQIATAVNELSAAATEVARNAKDVARAAEEADQEGQSAANVVSASVNNIYVLVENLESSGLSLAQLQKEVEAIASVVGVIRSIAEQTNLLALNAAIEAARAGDAGRGFAVVADEVRALASRTQNSTQEIQTMIGRLQQGTTKTVSAMQLSGEAGSSSREKAAHAQASLNAIAELINTITEMTTQIASAAGQQTEVSEDVNKSIHQIAIAADNVSQDIRKCAEIAGDLKLVSENLNSMIRQFRI